MPKLLGFDVWVEMEGVKLPEYKAETKNDEREISCWIPCETGKVSHDFRTSLRPILCILLTMVHRQDFRIGCALPCERVRLTHHHLGFSLDGRRAHLRGSVVKKEPHTLVDVVRHFEEERFDDGGSFRTFQIQFGELELTGV